MCRDTCVHVCAHAQAPVQARIYTHMSGTHVRTHVDGTCPYQTHVCRPTSLYTVVAYIVMAYIVMAYIVMACMLRRVSRPVGSLPREETETTAVRLPCRRMMTTLPPGGFLCHPSSHTSIRTSVCMSAPAPVRMSRQRVQTHGCTHVRTNFEKTIRLHTILCSRWLA